MTTIPQRCPNLMRDTQIIEKLKNKNNDSPATNAERAPEILEDLVHRAEHSGASDIHLQMRGKAAEVSFRLDGVISPVTELPEAVAERVIGRIKFLARLKTYQESLPQDGRIERTEIRSANDIRVATYPTVTGEKIVLRLFNSATTKTLGELDLPEHAHAELEHFLRQTAGLLLLTGPAGSGKTTTIYECLRFLTELGGRHIITVEDPAEQIVPGVMQTEVNEARGLDFAKAARHLLRQDPQVLVIGEIRDEETANIAVRAALTGHLVISTLHAGSCKGVFERLLVLCRDHSAVASSIALVLNQRLVRRLCKHCSGAGCERCVQTGYHGRLPAVECVRVTEQLRRRLPAHELDALATHPALADSAKALLQAGLTDAKELRRVFGDQV
ncbi:MAG TPA: ATPase, T2SS/T4P/T4SS family [Candidatus Angelobacter sp.]|nr:ATPase, T2SS/T4P/T4SS family [Candidatus Angelobacter sp.]